MSYTIADGLPSNTIYAIAQDSLGYIWLGTNKGLSRFDGTEFLNFSPDDGLADTEILKFFKDSKERIWYYTLNGRIGYIENGRLYTKETGSDIDPIHHQITSIREYNNLIYFSSRRKIFWYSDSLDMFFSDNKLHYLPHFYKTDTGLFLRERSEIFKVSSHSPNELELWDNMPIKTSGFVISNNNYLFGTTPNFILKNDQRKNYNSIFIQYDVKKKELLQNELNIGLTHYMKNQSDTSIFIFAASGLYQYLINQKQLNQVSSVYMPTDILQTKNGDLLITTYNNGLLLFHENQNIKSLIQTDSIKSSYLINDKIYYESLFSKIGVFDSSGIHSIQNLTDLRSIKDVNSEHPLIIGYHQLLYGKTAITATIAKIDA